MIPGLRKRNLSLGLHLVLRDMQTLPQGGHLQQHSPSWVVPEGQQSRETHSEQNFKQYSACLFCLEGETARCVSIYQFLTVARELAK